MEAYVMLISQGKKKRKYSITMLKKKKKSMWTEKL